MAPPENAIVICLDETPSIQAQHWAIGASPGGVQLIAAR
jgi:hypothetical protein